MLKILFLLYIEGFPFFFIKRSLRGILLYDFTFQTVKTFVSSGISSYNCTRKTDLDNGKRKYF